MPNVEVNLEAGEQPELPPDYKEPKPLVQIISEQDILKGDAPELDDYGPALAQAESSSDRSARAMLSIAEAVKQMMENQQSVRQIPYNEVKPVSPWNPEGKRNRIELARVTMINGNILNPMMMTEEEIGLCNQLKPGRYLDRKVEVQRAQDGTINLLWSNAKIEQRMERAALYPSFVVQLKAIIADREAKEAKRRSGQVEEQEYVG